MAEPALFVPDGDAFVATVLSQGAWDPGDANGGSTLALLAHRLDDVPTLVPMTLSRLTADLMRPLPLGRPLTVEASVVREGKKIQLVDLHLLVDGVLHARASALRLRDADLTGLEGHPTGVPVASAAPLVPPEEAVSLRETSARPGGFLDAVDMRYAPTTDGTGRGVWVRLEVPVVAGEPVRPVSRMALAFDYANNINVSMDPGSATTINPDVNAHVLRQAVGEWIALTGETRFNPDLGRGVSTAVLSDASGAFAYVTVTQLVQPRAR
ncbi:thioesterase family protein [Blastococcus sp. URHD0036]|uniref:thioesterase family protein n=1 Tax=Blastococcus sp. URHD0036 TaxID=1380356 RepID=UPI000495A556|nr:thioesterase family protein [Blastococcus sp. URHD0036]